MPRSIATGAWLLEKAIERASGEDYGRYVQRCIFERVGVERSAVEFDLPAAERAAIGHTPRMRAMTLLLWAMTPSRYWAEPAAGCSRAAALLHHGRGYGGLSCSALALARVLQDLLANLPSSE